MKMYQNGCPELGGTNELFHTVFSFFLVWLPLWHLGGPMATKMAPKGAKMTPRDTKIKVSGTKTAPEMAPEMGVTIGPATTIPAPCL